MSLFFMNEDPVQSLQEAFKAQLISYKLGDGGGQCPIYLSFEPNKRIPTQCNGCNGQKGTCGTYNIYMQVRGDIPSRKQ